MSAQPTALELADWLKERYRGTVATSQAAAMLRRQHEAIQELRAAVQGLLDPATNEDGEWYREARDKARAALKSTESLS